MESSQIIVFATIGLALVLFAWGRFRHDIADGLGMSADPFLMAVAVSACPTRKRK